MVEYLEVPTTRHNFQSTLDAEPFLRAFRTEHGVSKSRALSALGYGPLGVDDPNFNPVHRRRYYLTRERLLEEFEFVLANYNCFFDDEVKERYDDFMLDIHWFLKNRGDIHEGSVPMSDRRTNRAETIIRRP